MEEFIRLTVQYAGGGVWNNGSWMVRNQNRSGRPRRSVHATGRAVDLSWRRNAIWNGKKIERSAHGFGDYGRACQVVDFLVANADLFLIEEIHDYRPGPWGRGWRCSRASWKTYQRSTIGNGAPGGDWFHVEIAPAHADDAAYYRRAFERASGGTAPKPIVNESGTNRTAVDARVTAPPGDPELTRAKEAVVLPSVMALQAILISQGWATFTKPDGRYGVKTWKAVKAMQVALGLTGTSVDGRYGPNTSKRLAVYLDASRQLVGA